MTTLQERLRKDNSVLELETYADEAANRLDAFEAQVTMLLNKLDQHKQDWSRFHHTMKQHGLHPGRTDDCLIEILDKALAQYKADAESWKKHRDKAHMARKSAIYAAISAHKGTV